MISMQEAVKAARDYARQLYPEEELKGLRVEEIESSPDDKIWYVTLGWVEPAIREVGGFGGLTNLAVAALPRVYKVFEVDGETGRVGSMKMRD